MEITQTPFLTRAQLAERWAMSPRTLENWAVSGRGPKFCRFGKRVMYRVDDVQRYEAKVYGAA